MASADVGGQVVRVGADFVGEVVEGLVVRDDPVGRHPAGGAAAFVQKQEPGTAHFLDTVDAVEIPRFPACGIFAILIFDFDDLVADPQDSAKLGDDPLADPRARWHLRPLAACRRQERQHRPCQRRVARRPTDGQSDDDDLRRQIGVADRFNCLC